MGKSGLFSDVDPLACLLTRAKSNPVEPEWLTEKVEAIIGKWQPIARAGVTRSEANEEVEELEKSTPFRTPPNVFHWFSPYVVVNLCRILRGIDETHGSLRKRAALQGIFASIVRRVSRADPNTASGLEVTRIRKKELAAGLRFDVAAEFRKKAELSANGYHELLQLPRKGRLVIARGDAREWSRICESHGLTPDLVITSPCYMSAIEYWRRHKLEYCLLGLVDPQNLAKIRRKFLGMGERTPDVEELSPYLVGVYRKLVRSGFQREAANFARYFTDSCKWLGEVSKVITASGGTAYVVVGPNCTRGRIVNTPRGLQEMARHAGLKSKVLLRYRIVNYHMQYPTRGNTRIREETVLRFVPN